MSTRYARVPRRPASRLSAARILAAVALAVLAGDTVATPDRQPAALPAPGQALGEPPREPGADPVPAPTVTPTAAARSAPAGLPPASGGPPSFRQLPAGTRQVIRVTRSAAYCPQVYCTVIEAWATDRRGRWTRVPMAGGSTAVRAQIGRNGFAGPGRKREGDDRTPTGVYGVVTTFSTDERNPGVRMPWRQRRPTSNVNESPGALYNTWREVRGGSGGDRPAMRYGIWVNHNHGRLVPGRGPTPVPGRGSGIFIHIRPASTPHVPSAACVMAAPEQVRWMLRWLDPGAGPRVLLNV